MFYRTFGLTGMAIKRNTLRVNRKAVAGSSFISLPCHGLLSSQYNMIWSTHAFGPNC